jgi:non-specific serine/threonine protein kinase
MLYHYHLANRTKALDTFKECAALLKKHLDVTPSPETLALHQEILKYQVAPLPRAIPNNLPQALTSFIGRQRELSELSQLLEEKRLLSLAGVGGCGKTRLALELATTELKHYSDGIWWVELAALSDASLVVQALASAMGVQEQAKKTLLSTVSDALHTQEALIVLDNCEHVLTGSAELVQELLKGCTQLKIVVTSREPLGILGEVVWQVVPLAVPPQDEEGRSVQSLRGYEAVRLFEERARANEGKFEINKENAGAVAQICQRLDGLPLALELAAARVRGLSVREIARKLDKRFKLLAGGNRGALPRHQTLQGAMDWSYQLLTKKEQTLYYGGWRSLRGDGEWRQRSECVGERELSLKKCWR